MTRQPDVKSALKRLVFIPKTIEEEKISDDFKGLCVQDGLQVHDLMLEAIQLVFKVHHYPPGNPQLTLASFAKGKPTIELGKCGFANCKTKAIAVGVYQPMQKEYKLCQSHYRQAKNDSKNWIISKEPERQTDSARGAF